MAGVFVEDAEHRHVGEEVHCAHVHAQYFQPEALFEVGHEFVVAFGLDEVDIIIFHKLAALAVGREEVFRHPHHDDKQRVDDKPAEEIHLVDFAVEHRERHEEEEVSHFTDRHALRAVADNAENGEEPEGRADAHVAATFEQHADEHEDAHRKHQEGEVIVAPVPFGIIEEMHDDPNDHEVHKETHAQLCDVCRKGKVACAEKIGEKVVHGIK